MKRFVKNISMILIRLIIFIVIISAIIAVFELVLKFKNTHIQCETEDELYINGYYSDFNNIVNRINTQKILAGFWNYNAKDYTIMKRGDKIGSKNGKKRILVVGDSFVWGWAQDNINNVWWKQLSYALKKNGYQDVEIIAAGMNGFSIVDETQKIILDEEYIESIQPDLIIIGYVYNDWEIMDEKDEYFVKDLDENFMEESYIDQYINKGVLKKIEKIIPNIHDKIIKLLMKKEYSKEEFKEKYGYTYDEKKKLYLSDKYIDRVEEKAIIPLSKLDIPTIVVNTPFELNYSIVSVEFKEKVFSLLDKYKIKNYDMQEDYDKNFSNLDYAKDLAVNVADYHPNTRLMNFYATEIYNILQQDFKDIIGNQTEKFVSTECSIQDVLPDDVEIKKVDKNKYEFNYETYMDMLYYPYTDQRYIKFNLEYPTKINKIHIKTQDKCNLYVKLDLYNDSLGYEDEKNVTLDMYQINDYEYVGDVSSEKEVTSINISVYPMDLENEKVILEVE